MTSRQVNWQHRKLEQGRCPKCGGDAAYRIIEQDGIEVSRTRMRLCWSHLKYSRDYHRNIEPVKWGKTNEVPLETEG